MFQRSASAQDISPVPTGFDLDIRELSAILRCATDPNHRQDAEDQLGKMEKYLGFPPKLLSVVMTVEADLPVSLTAALYLKNLTNRHWADSQDEFGSFVIHEQDRADIREAIVDVMVRAPVPIQSQLGPCVSSILKHDFPDHSSQITNKISSYMQGSDPAGWAGAMICLYQLVKIFRFKKGDARGPLNEVMKEMLPKMYQVFSQILPDQSEESVWLQKQILKTYFAYIQNTLNQELISRDTFTQWMEILWTIADRRIPEHANTTMNIDDTWWKCKKWALHILLRIFQKYGSPGCVIQEYNCFALWYLDTFSTAILAVLLKILDQYAKKIYVSSQVLTKTLQYINQGVGHIFWWELLEPRMSNILQDVLFPILSYSQADEELWDTDPHEYSRLRFDMSEEYATPVSAARTLLHTCCMRRLGMLEKTIDFVTQVLNSPSVQPNQKDGAYHMIGTLSDQSFMKQQIEDFLCKYAFPEFNSDNGHLRSRVCWLIERFSEIKFSKDTILAKTVRLVTNALLSDQDLPVKAGAACALHGLFIFQERCEVHLEPNIRPITLELLNLICTSNIDMTSVLQTIVYVYTEKLFPLALDMFQKLGTTFIHVLDGTIEEEIPPNSLLDTLSALLTVMKDQTEIMAQIQPIVLNVVTIIFNQSITDFYKDAMCIVNEVTRKSISPDMWKVLDFINQAWKKDEFDYFPDIMPVLYNFITVDMPTFLADENHILVVFNMCKAVLTEDVSEDAECHAAKLLEVILLQCTGRIDPCIPSIVELALLRLMRDVHMAELRIMCLQVAIAALFYNPKLLFDILEHLQVGRSGTDSIMTNFIRQWVQDTCYFAGIHDRKVCVLGLCTLLNATGPRPDVLTECAPQIIPSILHLFEGIKRIRQAKVREVEGNTHINEQMFSSNYNNINKSIQEEALQDYLRVHSSTNSFDSTQDGDNCDDDDEETDLEKFFTPIDGEHSVVDEYVFFKTVLNCIEERDPNWYDMITCNLTTKQKLALKEVLLLAEQKKAAAESKQIENSGGYAFTQLTVPTSFRFGRTPRAH